MQAPRLMFVVTSHESVNLLLLPLLPGLVEDGWEVHLVCSPGPVSPDVPRWARVHHVAMTRSISPGRDLGSVAAMRRLMRDVRPDVVVASTPKAGLVGTLAARSAGVPTRVLHVWGARWDGSTGLGARAMRSADRVAAAAATDLLAVSESMRDLLRRAGITRRPVVVLGHGGSKGVDRSVFRPDPAHVLDPDAPVLGFAGRLAVDKGLDEVLRTYDAVRADRPGARLQVVGDLDGAQPIATSTQARLAEDPGVEWVRAVDQPRLAGFMRTWDLLVFPSRREGLPNVVIEAASCGVPAVAWAASGVRDAILPGRTGVLVPVGEPLGPAALAALEPAPHAAMRAGAEAWAAEAFDSRRVLADFSAYLHDAADRGRRRARQGFYLRHGKRWMDIAASSAALVVLSPVLAATAVVVRRRLGSPVLFTQDRGGLDGSTFRLLKFRTMTDERGPDGALLPDADRLTPLGRRLRGSSLDELPSLVNILRGDMSIVGPRPFMAIYLPRYSPEQARRHELRPGLTGWAQVNGRNAVDWEARFELDVWYVDHASLALDLRIIWRTLGAVLRREGISGEEHATMPEFTGSVAPEPPRP